MSLSIDALRSFVVLAEELHFGRAALRLHVSQPALTKQIKRLEAEIGGRLFERTTGRVLLTPAGDALEKAQAFWSPTRPPSSHSPGKWSGEISNVFASDPVSLRLATYCPGQSSFSERPTRTFHSKFRISGARISSKPCSMGGSISDLSACRSRMFISKV